MTYFINQPEGSIRIGDYLRTHLGDTQWTVFSAAVAFVKHSGVQYIADLLKTFSSRGEIRISVGVRNQVTSVEGLQDLLDCAGNTGKIFIYHNELSSTFQTIFHPKLYLFKNKTSADVLVGSGNLTKGGLFMNCEASIGLSLDLANEDNKTLLQQIESTLDLWSDESRGTARQLTPEFLQELILSHYILAETRTVEEDRGSDTSRAAQFETQATLFRRVSIPRPPELPLLDQDTRIPDEVEIEVPQTVPAQSGINRGFVMTLQRTDVGVGQVREGTSRRSPEIFIPLAARDLDPEFWGWPELFTPDPDPNYAGKMDRRGVSMRIGGGVISVNMMTWPIKHDFRLRSEQLRSAGNINDILLIERADGTSGFSYYVEVIPTTYVPLPRISDAVHKRHKKFSKTVGLLPLKREKNLGICRVLLENIPRN